jgi:O-antigen/teichoic acid export membrane protein
MTSLGLYDKAFSTVARVLTRMNTGGPNVTFRIFAIIHEDPERLRRAYLKVLMSATLVACPVFAALAFTAPQLIVVLYGSRWSAATVPFQLLCASGYLRVLNAYVSSAIQAAGSVWSQVWRQAIYVVLIVVGVFLFRDLGAAGAALGVMLATFVMTILMHALLVHVTPVRVGDVFASQLPALLCAGWIVVVNLVVQYGMSWVGGTRPQWLLVGAQIVASAVAFLLFVLFAPHGGLRMLVSEMAEDLAPASVKRHPIVRWYLNTPPPTAEAPAV